mgnify:CR=1 FL=1
MKNTYKCLLSVLALSVLFLIGCGGGGGSQSVLPSESPEDAVNRITASWRASNSSPAILVDTNGNFIRKAEGDKPSPAPGPAPSRIIHLFDLDNNSYDLNVVDVVKNDTTATVTCHYNYSTDTTGGYLVIVFGLIFDENKWWLDTVDITDKELPSGTAPYSVEHVKVTFAGVPVGEPEYETFYGKVGSAVSATPKTYTDGYEFLGFDYAKAGNVTVASGTITSGNTLVLRLYYGILKADYTVNHIMLNADYSIASTTTETLREAVGSTVTATVAEFNDYSYLGDDFVRGTMKTVISGVVAEDGTLVLNLYYIFARGLAGYVKDEASGAPIQGVEVQAFLESDPTKCVGSAITDADGYYAIDLEPGTYILVAFGDNYEQRTLGTFPVK